jgi:PAS domain S-box-containing protein
VVFAVLPPHAATARPALIGWGAGALLVILTASAGVPWSRLPAWCEALPSLSFFVVAALLRDGAGGADSGLTPLVWVPIMWLALYHERWLLLVGLICAEAYLLAPLLLADEVRYPLPGWRPATLLFAVMSAVGLGTHILVGRLRGRLTELAQAKAGSRAQSEFTGAILDTAANLIRVLDTEGRIALVNPAWEQATGYAAGAVRGRRPWELTGRPDEAGYQAGHFAARLHHIGQRGGPEVHEEVLYARAGGRRIVRWTDTLLRDANGRITHLVSTGLDITDQRNMENMLGHVLNAVPEQALIGTDLDGVVTFFNAGAERMLGYPAAEVLGVPAVEVLRLPDTVPAGPGARGPVVPGFDTLIAEARAGRSRSHELALTRADGTPLPVAFTVSEIVDETRAPIGYLTLARDVSGDRAAAQAMRDAYDRERASGERLRDLDAARAQFIAAASHDLRTPLTGVLTFLDLLGDEPDLTDRHRELLHASHRNADRLHRLIANLLTISQLDAGTLTLRRRRIGLDDLVEAALETVPADGVDLRIALPEPPVVVEVDPDQVERVLTHLLSNAVKFTGEGGRVTVAARLLDGFAEVSVSDTGVGIPADELPHIFDRFFRSSRTREVITGTGLGLAISKGIIEAHGGAIGAAAAPDQGTTITVTLPVAPAALSPRAPSR